jgi:hypothetical protein
MSSNHKTGTYIACKNGKEQVVNISKPPRDGVYECDYGVVSSHETYCTDAQLRELTPAEQLLLKSSSFASLPQQFYQSGPPGMPSMDAWKHELDAFFRRVRSAAAHASAITPGR